MLKQLVHSHHGKLQTFDDFYKTSTKNSKVTKSRSTSSESISGTSSYCSSPSPTSPCSPNSNPYTFYNVFADIKLTTTPDVVIEEDENEDEHQIDSQQSQPSTPVFYLEEEHHSPQTPTSASSSSSSPHWPSSIFNRLRHPHLTNHSIMKQTSVNEFQMNSTKLRKTELCDSANNKHRFLKRSETVNNANDLSEKKSSHDDFPELSLSTTNMTKKHRSFVTFFHHPLNSPSSKHSDKSNSTGSLHKENSNENIRSKTNKFKPVTTSTEIDSPVKRSPQTPFIPKLSSLFHRHHLSEQHKYRVGNIKARLHHRRHSPPLTNTAPKFHCDASNELIQQIQQLEAEKISQENDYIQLQRSLKPVIMKRVHTWHNTFDLRPLDQCLEY